MVTIERRPGRKMLEDPWTRSPALSPTAGGAPYGTSKVTEEIHLAITETRRNRQDKITGTGVVLVDGEEPEARASQDESLEQQVQPGTGTSRGESIQPQGPLGSGTFQGKRRQQRKRIEDAGQGKPAQPPSSRRASKVKTENGIGRERQVKHLAQCIVGSAPADSGTSRQKHRRMTPREGGQGQQDKNKSSDHIP